MPEQPQYTTVALIRTGLQKIGPSNIDDEFLDQCATSASSDCDLYSGKDNWADGDKFYGSIQGIALQLAIAYATGIPADKDVRQMNEWKMAIARLEFLRSQLIQLGIITLDAITGGTEGTTPSTYPNNPEGEEIIIAKHPEPTRTSTGSEPKTTDEVF